MIKSIKSLILLAIGFILTSFSLLNDIWILEKEGEGIKVYTKINEETNFKEFKAITITNQKMDVLMQLIEDVSNYPNWQENVTTCKTIKQLKNNEQYNYFTIDMPWPISNRDLVLHTTKSVSKEGIVTYTVNSIPSYIKDNEDYLRLKKTKGYWKFIPLKDNKIKIIYQFYGDPAGSIPNWLVNTFIVNGPYVTLNNMKKL